MSRRLTPEDGRLITENTTLQPGTYTLPSGLVITEDNLTVDGRSAILVGQKGQGRGLTLKNCRNVTLKNLRLLGYYHGIYAENCQNLTITNCQITVTAETPPNTAFLDIWKPAEEAYGAGIFLWKVSHSRIESNDLQHQMNGLLTYGCDHLEVHHNLANYCSGFGFHLFQTSHSHFTHNYADFCCREFKYNGQGYLGADAAGFLIVYYSSHNLFRHNYARLGGDGFFLSGLTSQGWHVPCNDNLFEENDGSHSPNNAFEATFSRGNIFRRNRANASNYGFWLGFSGDCLLEDNQIHHNHQAGIAVENGFQMTVRRNDFQANRYGLLLWSKYVPTFAQAVPDNDTSRHWLIEENLFLQNQTGIRIAANQDHGARPLQGNLCPLPHHHTLRRNRLEENHIPIELQQVEETGLEDNELRHNLAGDVIRINESLL